MRPGRLDRKIEIPLPNEVARMEILKIHALPIQKHGEIGKYSDFGLPSSSLAPFSGWMDDKHLSKQITKLL